MTSHYVQCCVQAKNSLEVMTVSVHVNKTDQGQFFGPEDEHRHATLSPMAHLSSARNWVSLPMQPVGQGPWAVPCPTPCWGSVWLCASGHRLDLCQAMCQQATSVLAHRCLSIDVLASCSSYRQGCHRFLSKQRVITLHDLGQI